MYTYMSRRRVYDNWEKLVEATLKRELLRELALCPSFSSSSSFASSSFDSSSRFDDSPFHVNELDAPSTSYSSQGVVVSSSSSNKATKARRFAARFFAAPATAFTHYIRKKPPGPPHKKVVDDDISEVVLGDLKRFSLEEVQVALDSFSNEGILGISRSGKVNKGRLADGSLVAVERLIERYSRGGKLEFQTSIEIAKMIMHPNLIRLLGICVTPTERILVYSYFSSRSVASCLRERYESQPSLDWSIRKQIAVETARGLTYLHDQKIIHGDVNLSHIYLNEFVEAVIGGFALAVFMDHHDTHVTINAIDDAPVTSHVYGTLGHIAPEYLYTSKSSEKTDVYSYGVMLLELITGKTAFGLSSLANDDDAILLDWVKRLLKEKRLETIIDANLQGNYIIEEVEQLIQVALLCTQDSPSERPEMSEVVRMLEGNGLAERWEEFQKEEMVKDQIISNSPSDYNYTDNMPDTEQEALLAQMIFELGSELRF